jgi:hypothetical protein
MTISWGAQDDGVKQTTAGPSRSKDALRMTISWGAQDDGEEQATAKANTEILTTPE